MSARILWVGYKGVGKFTQTGGSVTTDRLDLGREPGSRGVYELSGAGELIVEDRLVVGRSGNGALTLDGGIMMADTLTIGRYSGLGSLDITDAATDIIVGKDLTLGKNAMFGAACGSIIRMTQDSLGTTAAGFYNLSKNASSLSGLNNLELRFKGGPDLTASMEIGGRDYGAEQAGFLGNFALAKLQVGDPNGTTPANVMLMDDQDNGNSGSGPEVLYVRKIVITEGSTLNLNGHKVYCQILNNEGGTIELNGGVIEQVELSGDTGWDGDVDIEDLIFTATEWLWKGSEGCNDADLNYDGTVNLIDLAIICSEWTP